MKNKISLEERYKRVLAIISISEMVVKNSKTINNKEIDSLLEIYEANKKEAKEFFQNNKNSWLRQLEEELLVPWNESYDTDSDLFWVEVKRKDLGLERDDMLSKILERGYIANFKEYNFVQDIIVLYKQQENITKEQAKALNEMLGKYEDKYK